MKRVKLKFDKPAYLGAAILDLSKKKMYEFHYNYMKPKYGEKAAILYKDTDSLIYKIETQGFYKDIAPNIKTTFDTSNFHKDHPSGIATGINKKVIGMMKDEVGGRQITEFVGLRSKCYSFKIYEKEEKKCKGIKKSVVKNDIRLLQLFIQWKTTNEKDEYHQISSSRGIYSRGE